MKKTFLWDSNIYIDNLSKKPSLPKNVFKNASKGSKLIFPFIVEAEVFSNIKRRADSEVRLTKFKNSLQTLPIKNCYVNQKTVDTYIKLDVWYKNFRKSVSANGIKELGQNDMWIAAIGYLNKAEIHTFDKGFEVFLKPEFVNNISFYKFDIIIYDKDNPNKEIQPNLT